MIRPPADSAAHPSGDPADDVDVVAEGEPEPPWLAVPERRETSITQTFHGQRIDKALVAIAEEFSRNHLQGLIEAGHVSIEGVVVRMPSRKVLAGQTLRVDLVPTAESRAFRPEVLALNIVFEDEHLLVLDKAPGMVVHPAAGNWSGTLLNALLGHHRASASLPRAGIVHRLDKDTSGLMVVGKTLQATTALSRAIAAREIHREYAAIAQGPVRPGDFSIDAPIGRDPQSRIRMAVVATGKAARTDVHVVHAVSAWSALRCTLHTGRTHQIRVHLASRGHPLIADALYGGKPALAMARQALHAAKLEFAHPISGKPLAFEAPMPADLSSAWHNATMAGA